VTSRRGWFRGTNNPEVTTAYEVVEPEDFACCFRFGAGKTAVLLREPASKTVSDSSFRNISLFEFSKIRSAWDLNSVFAAVQIGAGNWRGRMNVAWWVSDVCDLHNG
jgi:hypothetical protein